MPNFDPYHKWLGIPPKDQPPNHYRLLGLSLFESDPEVIRRLVTDQLVSPVQWRQCMEVVKNLHPDAILEIGPGRILSGLVRVNGFPKKTVVYNVNNFAGLHRAVKELSGPAT